MTDFKDSLLKLNQNLQILQQREAKYGSNTPLDLLNQISDHKAAITLTEQALAGELTDDDWCEAMQPLLVDMKTRTSEAATINLSDIENSVLTIEGSVMANITAGGDVVGRDKVAIGQQINNFFRGTPDQQRDLKNREIMLKKVEAFWVKGVLENSLHDQVLIELGMEKHQQAVDHPWEMVLQTPDKPNQPIPSGTTMFDLFTQMQQSLLILGAPGSGKTTMLLELARDAISQALADANQPMPIVFNLSSWAEKQPPLADWLVDELNTKYNIPRKIAQPWVDDDLIFPLLDGLDEVTLEQRNNCLDAINNYREEHLVPLVVCSRIKDYEALSSNLKLHGAVLLRPLTLEQVEGYLEAIGPQYQAVRTVIQQDTSFQELLESPLMLSIVTLAYQETFLEQMQQSNYSTDTWRKHIFDIYLQKLFERKGLNQKYTPQQTTIWLIWLAQRMNARKQSVFHIEGVQPDWLQTGNQQKNYKWGSELIVGLIGGLIVGLFVGLFVGLIYGLIVGLIGGLIGGLFFRKRDIESVDGLKWSTIKKEGLGGELLVTLIVVLFFGLIYGVLVWLFLVLISGLQPVQIELRAKPNQGINQSLKNWLSVGLIFGLIFGLFVGLSDRLNYGMIVGLSGGSIFLLGVGLSVGLIFGLRFGGEAVIKHYTLRLILAHTGQLPFKLVSFLDYATERIFLRKVGGGYIFIHRLLLEHFAAMDLDTMPPSSKSSQTSKEIVGNET